MNTKYNYERFQDLGFEIEMRKKVSIIDMLKNIYRFCDKNGVTTISNIVAIIMLMK